MALFKIAKGSSTNLSNQGFTEGYCWFTPDDGKFYIDAKRNDVLTRIPLSADKADNDVDGNPINTTYLKLSGGIMSGSIVPGIAGLKLGANTALGAWSDVYADTYHGQFDHAITIGDKSYNGSSDVTLYASDLGVSSALTFAGVIAETLISDRDNVNYPSTTNPVHLYSDNSIIVPDLGYVVICHDTQDEFLWSEDSHGNQGWYTLGLASSFALHNHIHGNISNGGTIGTMANYALYTTTDGLITAGSLATSSPAATNDTATAFIDTITQDSKGQITATKKNLPVASDSVAGIVSTDTQSFSGAKTFKNDIIGNGDLTIAKTGEPALIVDNTSDHKAGLIIGSSSKNAGLWDYTNGKWIVYSTAAGAVTLNGNAAGLTNKTLNSTTINNTAGSFSFEGSGDPWSGSDWVGLQVDSGSDKFQLHAGNATTLEYRQNDSGGTNATDWGSWYSILSNGNYTSYVASVRDIGNGNATTFAFSKAGLNYGDYTWLAGWNGYELRAVNKSQFVRSGVSITAPSTASTWLTGQNTGTNAAYNVGNATNSDGYWPWMRQTNTSSSKWFSFGTLGTSFYWMGSSTSRTSNGYDHGMYFNVANGVLIVDGRAAIRDSGTTARSIFVTTSASVPSGAVNGDIVLVKV